MKTQPFESGQVCKLIKKPELICCVIAVSNQNLSPKITEAYPEMVVYVSNKGDIRSMPLEEFQGRWGQTGDVISRLEFFDQAAADYMAGFIAGEEEVFEGDLSGSDTDDVEDVDAVDATNTPAFNSGFSSEAEDDADGVDEDSVLNVGPHSLKVALETNFLSYAESPEGDVLVHKLEFLLQDGLTFDSIALAFEPGSTECIDVFSVGDIRVDWEVFSGVYPTVQPGLGKIATVFLKTFDSIALASEPVVAVPTPGTVAAQAPAAPQTLQTSSVTIAEPMPGNGAEVVSTTAPAPTFSVN